MYRNFFLILFLFLYNFQVFAKAVSIDALAKSSDVTESLTEEQLLTVNAYRQAVTNELEELKLDSGLFWNKLELKKMSTVDEANLLKSLFTNVQLARPATLDGKTTNVEENKPAAKLMGTFTADIDLEKLKSSYTEIVTDLAETKLKTFYFLTSIEIDSSMDWTDLGVTKAESFSGAIVESWKKLAEKDFHGFEKILILDKDFEIKPDYMNPKSVTLKWKSQFKKTNINSENKTATYELTSQYILVNSKNGQILSSYDFPTQKRELDLQNKKALSSALASLVFNLLNSQTAKILAVLEADAKSTEVTELEVKITTKVGLTEIYQINNLLQEKFKEMKLSSQMKSYSTDGSTLTIHAEVSLDKILAALSTDGGKFPLNEQKVLLFNPASKSFAIISKEQNN